MMKCPMRHTTAEHHCLLFVNNVILINMTLWGVLSSFNVKGKIYIILSIYTHIFKDMAVVSVT